MEAVRTLGGEARPQHRETGQAGAGNAAKQAEAGVDQTVELRPEPGVARRAGRPPVDRVRDATDRQEDRVRPHGHCGHEPGAHQRERVAVPGDSTTVESPTCPGAIEHQATHSPPDQALPA